MEKKITSHIRALIQMKFYSCKFSIFKVQIMRPKKFNMDDGLSQD